MEAIIQKWGNSNAIRIPKPVLKSCGMKENETVEIIIEKNGFTVQKCSKHLSLAQRLENFYGKPVEQIEKIESPEYDWGNPVGDEIW